jgi:hypothetical protein
MVINAFLTDSGYSSPHWIIDVTNAPHAPIEVFQTGGRHDFPVEDPQPERALPSAATVSPKWPLLFVAHPRFPHHRSE